MRKTAGIGLMVIAAAYGSVASAQASVGRLKGTIDQHRLDVPVQCDITKVGKGIYLHARTDGDTDHPQKDTTGDGIAGEVTKAGNLVGVHMIIGNDLYKFGGSRGITFHDQGFAWKATISGPDENKRQTYDVDIELTCE